MMPILPPAHPSLNHVRTFTSTARTLAKSTKQRLVYEHSAVSPYPYSPSQFYKQSNFGLYGMQKIRFGNKVSEKNEIKTRRYWRPNVRRQKLWSAALGMHIKLRITARVLRTVEKCGGLDAYLLGDKAQRIKELGMGGWKLRWRIMQTDAVKERFRLQREEFGLEPREENLIGADGNLVTKAQLDEEVALYDEQLRKEAEIEIGEEVEEAAAEGVFMEEQSTPKEFTVTR